MLTGIGFNSFNTVFGNAYNQTNRTLGQAIERLSSGLRINGAADDVANTARIQSLTSSISGYEVAERNLGDGVSLIRTAEAGISSIQTELDEIRELALQANNDTLGTVEKNAIQNEINSRLSNIDDIAGGSSFNGIKLLDASAGTLSIQTGTDSGDTDSIDLSGSFDSASADAVGNINEGNGGGALGEALNNIDVVTGNIDDIITGIDNAIENVAAAQSSLGAKENAFVSKSQSMSGSREAALATRSQLRDTDFARETSIAVRGFILRSSTVAMSSQRQANASLALTLLPMVR